MPRWIISTITCKKAATAAAPSWLCAGGDAGVWKLSLVTEFGNRNRAAARLLQIF
jgi:hypothetical protein